MYHQVPVLLVQKWSRSLLFESDLQEKVLSNYVRESKLNLQERDDIITGNKSLMTIIFEQCNDVTRTKISLSAFYKANHEARALIKFLTRVLTVCNGSYNGGLLFSPQVAKIKI